MTEEAPFDGIGGGFVEDLPDNPDIVVSNKKRDGSTRVTMSMLSSDLAELDSVAGLVGSIDPPITMFVTSTKWAKIAKDMEAFGKQPNPDNFRRLRIRDLIVVNSQSEDQEAVNLLNTPEAQRCNFQARRQHLISGKR
jgi:hypothetical protein